MLLELHYYGWMAQQGPCVVKQVLLRHAKNGSGKNFIGKIACKNLYKCIPAHKSLQRRFYDWHLSLDINFVKVFSLERYTLCGTYVWRELVSTDCVQPPVVC